MEIMTYWVRFLGLPDDAQAATAARLARQKVLSSGRRRFIVVLAEQVLRTRLGTPQVMAAQLEHLLEVMGLPNLSVGIIPAMAERYTVARERTPYRSSMSARSSVVIFDRPFSSRYSLLLLQPSRCAAVSIDRPLAWRSRSISRIRRRPRTVRLYSTNPSHLAVRASRPA